jgi:predicted Fe-Mo cluster-binding NifX family protein
MTKLRLALIWVFLATAVALGIVAWTADPPTAPAAPAQPAAKPAQPKALFAIAAMGKEVTAPIYFLAARASHYHLYDENGNLVEVMPNPYLGKDMEIGPVAAQMLADRGVNVLVAGMAGPKMKDVLVARKVRFVSRKGTVQGVVDELRK